MPVITINSNDSAGKLELREFAEKVSMKSGIAVSRLQIIAKYYPPEDFFSEKMHTIIQIAASERNGKNTIQELMKACVSAAAEQFNVEESRIAVTAYPVGRGYLLANNEFI
jgi:predicted peptidase